LRMYSFSYVLLHTLYARLLNAWLVLSPAGDAYRHRIALLVDEMRTQARRCRERWRPACAQHWLRCGERGGALLELEELTTAASSRWWTSHPDTLAFALAQVEKARQQHWRLARVTLVPQSIRPGDRSSADAAQRSGLARVRGTRGGL